MGIARTVFAVGVLAAGLPLVAWSQAYPAKPVRMIAPFPPGGTTDSLARLVGQKLTEGLGATVIIDNRPGASGNIGLEVASKAAPDGYTLVLAGGAALVTNQFLYKRLGFDPHTDFIPISIVATAAPVLVVHPAVPARNVKELIALAKARPGQLNFGSGGVGTTSGGVLAVIALVGGQLDLSFSDMVPAVPQIKAGKLRALAVTSEQRSPTLPDVPTMAEAGVTASFPTQWWTVAAPKGTPPAIITRINTEIGRFMKQPDVQEKYTAMGIFTAHTTPERVTEMMKQGEKQMAAVVKAAGIQPE
jgi:tripartite-type tricarboxylate transporter receptor subunit TctC